MSDPTPALQLKNLFVRLAQVMKIRADSEKAHASITKLMNDLQAIKKPRHTTLQKHLRLCSQQLFSFQRGAVRPSLYFLDIDEQQTSNVEWPIGEKILFERIVAHLKRPQAQLTTYDKDILVRFMSEWLKYIESALELVGELETLIVEGRP